MKEIYCQIHLGIWGMQRWQKTIFVETSVDVFIIRMGFADLQIVVAIIFDVEGHHIACIIMREKKESGENVLSY